jgi:hypothetical protein
MTQRGTDPKGTFTCGCGVRVAVQVADRSVCMGLEGGSGRCGLVPVRESAEWNLSLCGNHLEGFLATLDVIREAERAREVENLALDEIHRESLQMRERWAAEDAARNERYASQSVVYYVRLGGCIKIGTTTNMKMRMNTLMPDEILATEPGTRELEQMRHKQFAGLRVRGERFLADPELLSHIQMIRAHFGEPKMTGYLHD